MDIELLIDNRIKKIARILASKQYLSLGPRRIHPAFKQMKGRLLELQYLKREINKSE